MKQLSVMTGIALCLLSIACNKSAKPESDEPAASSPAGQPIPIKVDAAGYHPSTVQAPPSKPVRLLFTRTSDDGCGQQLVFPALNIRKDLPLNKPVPVDFDMPASGSVAFTCGMDMYRGSVVAK
jgi:plastocyanin domain-containing protein